MYLSADDSDSVAEFIEPFDNYGNYSEKLIRYRNEHNLTREELSKTLGVNVYTLRSWELKKVKPPYHIWRLYKHLFDNEDQFK